MDSREFGKLLAALRKQNLNDYGKTWTREELSRQIHISAHQLGRLERGSRKYLDTETLQLLADAFNLTTLERKELFFAAVGISEDDIVNPDDTENRTDLSNLVEALKLKQSPAFLVDDYADIVAVNLNTILLYQVSQDYLSADGDNYAAFNLMKFVYDEASGYKEAVGAAWEDMAKRNINYFRRITLRKRHKAYFNKILGELRRLEKFDLHWHEISRSPSGIDSVYDYYRWHHPSYGPVHMVFTESTIPTRHGNLHLFIYTPCNLETAEAFYRIAREAGEVAFQLSPWPQKPLNESEDGS